MALKWLGGGGKPDHPLADDKRASKLARDYLSNPRLPKFQEGRLWGALFGLWKDLAGAYAACVVQFAADAGSVDKLEAQLPLVRLET